MNRHVMLAMLSAAMFAAAPAHASKVTWWLVGGSSADTRPCAFFQVDSFDAWYAIPFADPGYETERDTVYGAYLSRDEGFLFAPGSPVGACSGIPAAVWIQLKK